MTEEDYSDISMNYLLDKMKKDPAVVAITSGTPTVMGFTEDKRKEAGKQLRAAGINLDKLKIIASIENQETIKKSVKQGMGISVISRLAAEDEVKYGDLLAFSIPKADQGRDINLVYNKNYQMSKSTERFVKIVKEIYGIEE